jgi:hypothetical protein
MFMASGADIGPDLSLWLQDCQLHYSWHGSWSLMTAHPGHRSQEITPHIILAQFILIQVQQTVDSLCSLFRILGVVYNRKILCAEDKHRALVLVDRPGAFQDQDQNQYQDIRVTGPEGKASAIPVCQVKRIERHDFVVV